MSTLNNKQRLNTAGRTSEAKERNTLKQRHKARTWLGEERKYDQAHWDWISEPGTEPMKWEIMKPRLQTPAVAGCCLYAEAGVNCQGAGACTAHQSLFAEWDKLGCVFLR